MVLLFISINLITSGTPYNNLQILKSSSELFTLKSPLDISKESLGPITLPPKNLNLGSKNANESVVKMSECSSLSLYSAVSLVIKLSGIDYVNNYLK